MHEKRRAERGGRVAEEGFDFSDSAGSDFLLARKLRQPFNVCTETEIEYGLVAVRLHLLQHCFRGIFLAQKSRFLLTVRAALIAVRTAFITAQKSRLYGAFIVVGTIFSLGCTVCI